MSNAALAVAIYDLVLRKSESFEEDHVGSDLAYLLGAILKESVCEWPKDRPILRILEAECPPGHPIWRYARIERED